MLDSHTAVEWWFAFKFAASTFPNSCTQRVCRFGGTPQPATQHTSQRFVIASSAHPAIQDGGLCIGDSTSDPVAATFDQIYSSSLFYVVWNDEFNNQPIGNKGTGWGHSKGIVAWNSEGNGVVMQVTTPNWPGFAASSPPRPMGNTLGCISKDNNIQYSQHFFALKLNKDDVGVVLDALRKSAAPTSKTHPEIVRNGGPQDIQLHVQALGLQTHETIVSKAKLSSGVFLIAKPPDLNVPPWQLVSEELDAEPLLAATWWSKNKIPSTNAATPMRCWDPALKKAGPVTIAKTGTWQGTTIGLEGGVNHAKFGVSKGTHTYSIFGDMNQEGSISKTNCKVSQNVRGGLFFVVDDAALFSGVSALLTGSVEP